MFRLQRHGGGGGCERGTQDSTRSLRITPRDCAMATSRGHCSTDNIRASVILKLRSRHASVRPSVRLHRFALHQPNTIIVSSAIVYRSWLPKFLSTPRFRSMPSPSFPRINVFHVRDRREFYFSLVVAFSLVIRVTFCCLLTVASKINQVHAYSTSFQTEFPRKLRFQGNLVVLVSVPDT